MCNKQVIKSQQQERGQKWWKILQLLIENLRILNESQCHSPPFYAVHKLLSGDLTRHTTTPNFSSNCLCRAVGRSEILGCKQYVVSIICSLTPGQIGLTNLTKSGGPLSPGSYGPAMQQMPQPLFLQFSPAVLPYQAMHIIRVEAVMRFSGEICKLYYPY